MAELEDKIREVSRLYTDLKKQNSQKQQVQLMGKLDQLCSQTQKLLEASLPTADNLRRIKQLKNVQDRVKQLQIESQQKSQQYPIQSSGSSQQNQTSLSREQISKQLVRSIAMQQIKSKELKVSPEKLEELAQRMENNKYVMEEIGGMINEHGENLELIEQNIKHAYEEMQQVNEELDEAASLSIRARMKKIRLGLGGLLAALGWGILGIPGMILGFIAGLKTLK